MDKLHLNIVTPRKTVFEKEILSVSVSTSLGEITVLPHHVNLFCLLVEGVVKIREEAGEDFLSIGGGYLETDGKKVNILVSRAYGQDEIDERLTAKALEEAKNILEKSKDEKERSEAAAVVRRSIFDLKILKKRKRGKSSLESMRQQ